jgi:hypothetical protein
MSTLDPSTIRQAVAEFTPRRPQRFQELLPAKDVIAELRQRHASFRAIAELLTEHCLPTGKTAIAEFCHEVLGERVRPYRRSGRKQPIAAATPNRDAPAPAEPKPVAPTRTRGPRIAQVRMLPQETK